MRRRVQTWNPDIPSPIDFFSELAASAAAARVRQRFQSCSGNFFLRHIVRDEPFPWDLREAAKGVQLAEKGLESWEKRCWMDVPELEN